MDKNKEYDDDFLRPYINPGKIEKAPHEFTSKTMTRIRLEAASAGSFHTKAGKWIIPLLSILIIALLITSAFLFLPSGGGNDLFSGIPDFISDFRFSLPDPEIRFLKNINLPDWTIYGTICIFILAFFDRALWGLFHRER